MSFLLGPGLPRGANCWFWGVHLAAHLSNEKRAPGCLGYRGDEKLPRYVGIIS